MEFSTLNESSLHNILKKLYAFETNGRTEVKRDNFIYDILTENNEIIEIQTGSLVHLLPKIEKAISEKNKIKIVHPVIIEKTIITKDKDRETKRKSPKKGSIYSSLKELTGIYKILLNEYFTLEILEVNITEYREKTDELTQSKNKKRRFKKDWNKTGKKLNSIIEKKIFNNKEDYLSLLPNNIPEEFSSKEIKELFKQDKHYSNSAIQNTNLLLWLLSKMNLITQTKKISNRKYYKIS